MANRSLSYVGSLRFYVLIDDGRHIKLLSDIKKCNYRTMRIRLDCVILRESPKSFEKSFRLTKIFKNYRSGFPINSS